MTAEEYEAAVARVVDEAPPLTAEQRDRLRTLLAPPERTEAAA